MIDYWELVRGLKRGECPNPTRLLYAAYLRWARANHVEEPASSLEFVRYLESRGYKKGQVRTGRGVLTCWLLSKYVVPRSAVS